MLFHCPQFQKLFIFFRLRFSRERRIWGRINRRAGRRRRACTVHTRYQKNCQKG